MSKLIAEGQTISELFSWGPEKGDEVRLYLERPLSEKELAKLSKLGEVVQVSRIVSLKLGSSIKPEALPHIDIVGWQLFSKGLSWGWLVFGGLVGYIIKKKYAN